MALIELNHDWFMSLAIEEAEKAYREGEVPVGALLVDEDGNIVAKGRNIKESCFDPCGHAEIEVIRLAAKKRKNWRLTGHTLYVTLEPCVMCAAAIIQARLSLLVFGAYDPKGGAISLGHYIHIDSRLNHSYSVIGGIKHFDCSKILSTFFRERRNEYKQKGNNL